MTVIAGVKLADMKRSKESLKGENVGKISPDPYSYEHRISLDQDALTKLGVSETPKIGDVFHVMGHGHVTNVSSDANDGGKNSLRVGLQLRKLGVKPATAKPGKATGGTPKANGAFAAVNEGIKDAGE